MPKKIAIIALLVIAIVAVAGAATYIVQQRSDKWAEKVRQEKEQVATLPEKPEIDTSDWQTYRNVKYGFEVRYPKDFFIFSTTSPGISLGRRLQYMKVDAVAGVAFQQFENSLPLLAIYIFENPKQLPIESWLMEAADEKLFSESEELGDVLPSLKGLKVLQTKTSDGPLEGNILFFTKGGLVYFLILVEQLGREQETPLQFGEIIRSFRLLKWVWSEG